jgi:phage N-6-adenine-methyltransferase
MPLGTELKLARTSMKLSQSVLADRAGVSMPTIGQAEKSEGRLDTFMKIAAVLGLTVGSRTPLPTGNNIGEQLATYRTRLGKHSQRSLAKAAGLNPETVAAIDAGRIGHLAALEAVASTLGVTLCLEQAGRTKSFVAGAATSSAYECWTTTQWVMDKLYTVIGSEFDLDPCSPTKDRQQAPVRARRYFTEADDGLSRPWRGAVYMNPPYGRTISDWVAKAAAESASGRAVLVIGLVPARVDTAWWHRSVAGAGASVTFLQGRLSFGGEGGSAAPFPSALILWGGNVEHEQRLRGAFPAAWHVPGSGQQRAA